MFDDLRRWHQDVLGLVVVSGALALVLGFLSGCILVAILEIGVDGFGDLVNLLFDWS